MKAVRKTSFMISSLLFIVGQINAISTPPRYGNSLVDAYDYMTTSSGGKSDNQGMLSGLFGFQDLYNQWQEVYGFLANTEEYQQKVRDINHKYGIYRSGEGTPEELLAKA